MAHPRIVNAFRAMKALGISEDKVKPVLKRLLKLYNKNWDLIEEENYRPLIDAIFDHEEAEAAKREKASKSVREENLEEEEVVHEEPERPLKRHRLRQQDGQASPSSLGGTSQLRHDVEGTELLGLPHSSNGCIDSESQPASCPYTTRNKGKEHVSPNAVVQETYSLSQPTGADKSQQSARSAGSCLNSDRGKEVLSHQTMSAEKKLASEKPSDALCVEKPSGEPSNPQSSNKTSHGHLALIKPKEEPITEEMHLEVPVSGTHSGSVKKGGSSNANGLISNQDRDHVTALSSGARYNGMLENNTDKFSILDIASSTCGEVKVNLNCGTGFAIPDFQMPSLDAVVKLMEDKCLTKYKDLDPNFCVTKVMQDVCQCFLELGAQSTTTYSSLNCSESTIDD